MSAARATKKRHVAHTFKKFYLNEFLDCPLDTSIDALRKARTELLDEFPDAENITTHIDEEFEFLNPEPTPIIYIKFFRMETDDEFAERMRRQKEQKLKQEKMKLAEQKKELKVLATLAKKHGKRLT